MRSLVSPKPARFSVRRVALEAAPLPTNSDRSTAPTCQFIIKSFLLCFHWWKQRLTNALHAKERKQAPKTFQHSSFCPSFSFSFSFSFSPLFPLERRPYLLIINPYRIALSRLPKHAQGNPCEGGISSLRFGVDPLRCDGFGQMQAASTYRKTCDPCAWRCRGRRERRRRPSRAAPGTPAGARTGGFREASAAALRFALIRNEVRRH